jgi:hypothetical protein
MWWFKPWTGECAKVWNELWVHYCRFSPSRYWLLWEVPLWTYIYGSLGSIIIKTPSSHFLSTLNGFLAS